MFPRHGKPSWSLHLVIVVDKASHLRSAICFRQKDCKEEKLGYSQQEHRNFIGVEILGARLPP